MSNFAHLHVHTAYSLLDGSIKIKNLINKVAELNMPAVAITDHGAMYGAIEFYKAAVERGIKPIIGCEVYVAPHSRNQKETKKEYHLVLLAQNKKGYENLTKLVSIAYLEGFYYKPRVDKEVLAAHSEGLIALSACLAGEIPALILQGSADEAKKAALQYKEIFKERFYLELQDHGIKEQKTVNEALIKLGKELNIPLVATNDVHYLERKDAEIHDILFCIQTQKTINDPDRMRFEGSEFYLKTEEEMYRLFQDVPEAITNTKKIADMIDLKFDFNQRLIPPFEIPDQYTSAAEYLKDLCYQGLEKRYDVVTPEIKKRLEYELNVINKMGYDNYFLIVWDFVRFAKANNIYVGPGRGSAAGSLVAYTLFITDLDPLPYGLLFERFLNPDRVSMPDIDIDFCYEKRDQVINYVIDKYGADRVAQIITFGTMAARMAIRDTGRALGIPYKEVDLIAKAIPQGTDIKTALEINADLKKLYDTNEKYRKLIDISSAIEGLPRHTSTHAAGVVISADELTKYTPIQKMDGVLTTQYDMWILEDLGLLKMDFLGLKTLTIIHETIQKTGQDIDISKIPLDDPKTFELLARGDTVGVFQLESSGMQSILKELKPSCFEEIIAVVALYRPGPMEQIPKFIKSKHGEEPIAYPHPDLEDILKETYGVIVYQEQIISLASCMAGFSLSQADILRRAIGKKKKEVLDEQKSAFINGVINQGYNRQIGENLFDLIEKFASYGFNKSHAAAYALIAYQTAYLKANYPVEFMASLLTNAMSNKDDIAAYVADCKKRGIEILPPDINESYADFTVKNNDIRFGLAAVKNVGLKAIDSIILAREKGKFTSLYDFCSRINLTECNRKTIESLIKSGAFDSLGKTRASYLSWIDHAVSVGQKAQVNQKSRQMSLLSQLGITETLEEPEEQIPEIPHKDKLFLEKEMLGLYVTDHPLGEFRETIEKLHGIENISQAIKKGTEKKKVIIAGIINSVKKTYTKKNQPMAFLKVEDLSKEIEVVIFPQLYETCQHLLQEDEIIVLEGTLEGKVEENEQTPKLICSQLKQFPRQNKIIIAEIRDEDVSKMKKLRGLLLGNQGNTPVYLYLPRRRKTILTGLDFWVKNNQAMLDGMSGIVGNVSVMQI